MNKKRLKVGFLSQWDINDHNVMSGSVHQSMLALKNAGLDIVDLGNLENGRTPEFIRKHLQPARKFLTSFIPQNIKTSYQRKITAIESFKSKKITFNDHQRMINNAKKYSRLAQNKLNSESQELDVLFGICTSTIFYQLETDIPILYASDTTANLLNSTYPEYMARSDEYHQACDKIEKKSLDKSAFFLPAANCAKVSAIEFYKLPKEKVRLVEFGAHVTPTVKIAQKQAPDNNNLQLCLVAADPIRKQLTLCIEIAETLNSRGWNTTLNYIGPHHDSLNHTEVVKWHGRLQLSDLDDRKKHQEIMESSHWMLLPSTAEAFGIAPCEAAHFAVPSIVTNVGGLPTVVQDQRTGVVMSLEATASSYADEIITISQDKSRYLEMSAAALERAENTLSWSAWAEKVKALMYQAIEEKETSDCNVPTSPKPALQSQAL